MTNRQKKMALEATMVVLCILALLLMTDFFRRVKHSQESNYLDNMLYDLEHPTQDNAAVRQIACTDVIKKVDGWMKLPGVDHEKIARFMKSCAQQQEGLRW